MQNLSPKKGRTPTFMKNVECTVLHSGTVLLNNRLVVHVSFDAVNPLT